MILTKKALNNHIKLSALDLPPLKDSQDAPMQRLNLLAQTQRYSDIKNAV
jgi:hypothetical protein